MYLLAACDLLDRVGSCSLLNRCTLSTWNLFELIFMYRLQSGHQEEKGGYLCKTSLVHRSTMPPKEQLKQGAPDMKAAAKNALIFTMVEQHFAGKKGITQRDHLETVQHAIQLYDTHVDALGHAACMSAVKRFLDMHTFSPAEWRKMTPEERQKIRDENAAEEAKLTAEQRKAMQKKRDKRKKRAERKKAKKNGAHHDAHGDVKYAKAPKEKWDAMSDGEKNAYKMAYKIMKKQAHGNHEGAKHKKQKKQKKQPSIMKQLLKYAKKLWKDEVAKMPAEEVKFLTIEQPVSEGLVDWKRMTLEEGKVKLKNWHDRGIECLGTRYDATIARWVGEGRVYFPKKYDRPEGERLKDFVRNARRNDLRDARNWTDLDKKTAYKAFLKTKKKENKVHKHMGREQWNAADANTRLAWIMNDANWEDIINYELDTTVMEYRANGRVFFKPSGYKDADQSKRLSMHRVQKNWSNVNTKETWEMWKQALNKAKQSGKPITKINRLTDTEWDAMTGQQRMMHEITNTLVDEKAILTAELKVRGAEELKKTQAARK